MRIARVFCRRTNATPTDSLAFVNEPPPLFLPEVEEIHICAVFTYDLPAAARLQRQWEAVGVPVKIGGPAFDQPSGEFIPGLYVKKGITITSRGCPNHCWFCRVPIREKGLRELEIKDGWNIFDDNILACSEDHIRKVFAMLKRQPERPCFTGGLEAKLLKPWHCELLRAVGTKHMYFAYDTADDLAPLQQAGKMLLDSGFTVASHAMKCYVLIGYPGDTFAKAEKRLRETMAAGFMPFAMLYRDKGGEVAQAWQKFQREWLQPRIVGQKMKEALMTGN